MGTGNKLDASKLEVTDISKTTVCPLARIMRKELRKRGINHLKVVYSTEEALTPAGVSEEAAALGKRTIPGSTAFVPGAAGLILAGEVIRDLIQEACADGTAAPDF
jgi:tRNA A37 threonylcarbamoyladenosine dehydratase